jgi:two-component system chemotaxis response regulator CheB
MTVSTGTICSTIRVLVVDDSASARRLLCRELAKHPGIEVVGTAIDPYGAREQIVALRPDVLTLDIQMPRMDGITFLRRLMKHHPLPVVVISALGKTGGALAIEALSAGAVDVVCKPSAGGVESFSKSLAEKIHIASKARIHSQHEAENGQYRCRQSPSMEAIFVMGASTGGVQAITEIVSALPADVPPLLIVQHMPAGFTASFAQRLDGLCKASVKEAVEGDAVIRGRVLIAPGGRHMVLRRRGNGFIVGLNDEAQVCHQRPSIDVLFNSVAELAASEAIGVLLTGMGADGAEGLLQLRRAGAHTIAQDEQTSTVFGMPAEAIRLGAAQSVLPVQRIAQAMMTLANGFS